LIVERSTAVTDWVDVLETGWTEAHVSGLQQPEGPNPTPCQGEVAGSNPVFRSIGAGQGSFQVRLASHDMPSL
jgi:hypothetical protein